MSFGQYLHILPPTGFLFAVCTFQRLAPPTYMSQERINWLQRRILLHSKNHCFHFPLLPSSSSRQFGRHHLAPDTM